MCLSLKASCSSFHAHTYLRNSVLKTKSIFKAVTICSFTALQFSWAGETLAKSWISSVRIIIPASSLLSFFSWGFVRGIQGAWWRPSELFFSQTSLPRHAAISNHRAEHTAAVQWAGSSFQWCDQTRVHNACWRCQQLRIVLGSCTATWRGGNCGLSRAYKRSGVTIYLQRSPSGAGEKQSRLFFCDSLREVLSSDCQGRR